MSASSRPSVLTCTSLPIHLHTSVSLAVPSHPHPPPSLVHYPPLPIVACPPIVLYRLPIPGRPPEFAPRPPVLIRPSL
ncbi:hypothetical protein BDN70DRAFT_887178 [Pholiota conissans]|uniref:Uncharacterized protein n=1 Tax=Pholiota conissans TaxID=109636 RepID=A0A9P5YM06_9AGAR|nr:hypothetical protein BDN70DRAFT_887178 [Pholiota conissans]